jgi:signal transduction histidine kinase
VKLKATVGFIEAPGTVFVQDATAGTFLRTKLPLGDLREGDVVEAVGKTFPGLFLPGVELDSFRIVSHGEPPTAQSASYDDLLSARFHYQRVSVEGIVRSVTLQDENRSVLHLAMGSRVLEVRVDGSLTDEESLVDAKVRVEGLAAGTINDRRQLVQPYVRVSRWSAISTLERARPQTELPRETTTSLLRFSADGDTGHRVLVEGTVTALFKNGLAFIKDEDASVAVQLSDASDLRVGERITVAGFPIMERFTPSLVDVAMVNRAEGETPEPVRVAPTSLPTKVNEGDFISITGKAAQVLRNREGVFITVLVGDALLPVVLEKEEPLSIEPGSIVDVTGIVRVESVTGKGFNARPASLRVWLRSASDVRVLSAPPFWDVRRLLTILGVLGLIMLAAAVWIVLLRRQVSRLQLRIRHEAALEERQRIAREFHDTLEQELAGLSLRMDAAATRPMEDKARALLETSRSLVSRIQIEARNLVADLRDDPEAQVELPAALEALAQRQPANAPTIHVETEGELPSLPAPVVHHLRMIAQEAVTNALKHAQATSITLRLRAMPENAVELDVIDDGKGFDSTSKSLGQPGHFGCMGIRERCRKLGADVTWHSTPGQGTTVTVRLPL